MRTQIAGDIGRRRPAEYVLDPIFANALVVEAGNKKACILSLDILIITRNCTDRIRREAESRFRIEPKNIMVHPVQNHAAPSLGHFMISENSPYIPADLSWARGGDDRYIDFAIERILDAIGKACDNLHETRLGLGRGFETHVAENRRFIMKDGSVMTHVGGEYLKDVICWEGPIDPEVGIATFLDEDLNTTAQLLHYTCHPVHGYPKRYISGGWPGDWARRMQSMYGKCSTPLVINGCCGNIHHSHHLDPSWGDDFKRDGRLLAKACDGIMKAGLSFDDDDTLDVRTEILKIPYRRLPADQVEAAKSLLEKHPDPMWLDESKTSIDWDWIYAVSLLDLDEEQIKQRYFEYEIQIFRIGQLALIALPGELFVEGQLEIKQKSPAAFTFFAHVANHYVGYIPTPEAIKRGGYETRTANWSKLAPEAMGMIVNKSNDMLNELF